MCCWQSCAMWCASVAMIAKLLSSRSASGGDNLVAAKIDCTITTDWSKSWARRRASKSSGRTA